MWVYEKRLEYPIKIKTCNPKMAQYIITQYGGPDGELGASLRYLSQRFTMPCNEAKGILNDIGTEELAHLEMVGSMVYQLLKDATPQELEKVGLGGYYADHRKAIYPVDATGNPYTATSFASKGDPVADLTEDMAAEQKARATYENLIRLSDDPDIIDPLKFLRAREIVHFQRFGEALDLVQDRMNQKKHYMNNPNNK
jgi:spore coat protein JC